MNNSIRRDLNRMIRELESIENDVNSMSISSDFSVLIDRLQDYVDDIDSMQSEIQDYADEEQEKYDNMPESLQDSDRAYQYQDAADALQDAADNLNSDEIQDIISLLEDEDSSVEFDISFSDVTDSLETACNV